MNYTINKQKETEVGVCYAALTAQKNLPAARVEAEHFGMNPPERRVIRDAMGTQHLRLLFEHEVREALKELQGTQ